MNILILEKGIHERSRDTIFITKMATNAAQSTMQRCSNHVFIKFMSNAQLMFSVCRVINRQQRNRKYYKNIHVERKVDSLSVMD